MVEDERVLKHKVDLLFAIIVRYGRDIVVLKLQENLSTGRPLKAMIILIHTLSSAP